MTAASDLEVLRTRTLAHLHEVHRTLDERAFYPAHDMRVESSAFTRVRRQLIETEGVGCRICGVTEKTLRSREKNPYRARQMEAHHYVIERAHANAVDVGRFNELVAVPRYGRGEMIDRIDHGRDNLWVLCDVPHRQEWFGVHAISGPVWGAQRFLREVVAREVRGR